MGQILRLIHFACHPIRIAGTMARYVETCRATPCQLPSQLRASCESPAAQIAGWSLLQCRASWTDDTRRNDEKGAHIQHGKLLMLILLSAALFGFGLLLFGLGLAVWLLGVAVQIALLLLQLVLWLIWAGI